VKIEPLFFLLKLLGKIICKLFEKGTLVRFLHDVGYLYVLMYRATRLIRIHHYRIEKWLANSTACVKWNDVWSTSFRVNFGVRQGSVLSPFLFNIYLDNLAKLNNYNNRSFVIIYVDDILLIAQSVSELQKLLSACENELQLLDMVINRKKSCCLRIGPRCNVSCANISSQDGRLFSWVSELRYHICMGGKNRQNSTFANQSNIS